MNHAIQCMYVHLYDEGNQARPTLYYPKYLREYEIIENDVNVICYNPRSLRSPKSDLETL